MPTMRIKGRPVPPAVPYFEARRFRREKGFPFRRPNVPGPEIELNRGKYFSHQNLLRIEGALRPALRPPRSRWLSCPGKGAARTKMDSSSWISGMRGSGRLSSSLKLFFEFFQLRPGHPFGNSLALQFFLLGRGHTFQRPEAAAGDSSGLGLTRNARLSQAERLEPLSDSGFKDEHEPA